MINNNNNEISLSDEDPTLELEPLSENLCAEMAAGAGPPVELVDGDKLRLGNDPLQEKCDSLAKQVASLLKTNESLRHELERNWQQVATLEKQLMLAHDSRQELLSEFEAKLNAAKPLSEHPIPEVVAEKSTPPISAAHRLPRRDSGDCLVLIGTNGGGSDTWLLDEGTINIGSSPDCDIPVESRFVSRCHARLIITQHAAVLEDLNSTNGTYINARRIKKRAVSAGDLISIGKTRFRFDKQSALPVAGEIHPAETSLHSGRTSDQGSH